MRREERRRRRHHQVSSFFVAIAKNCRRRRRPRRRGQIEQGGKADADVSRPPEQLSLYVRYRSVDVKILLESPDGRMRRGTGGK